MSEATVALSFAEISQRLRAFHFPNVDGVVGIATGGTVPACLVAHQLQRPVWFLSLNFRDANNRPQHAFPQPTAPVPEIPPEVQHILLVDEVSVTGSTLTAARNLITAAGRHITTFVLKGRGPADLVLFPEIEPCVRWPWK